MALFGPFYVTTTLRLSEQQDRWLRDLSTHAQLVGEHTHGIQLALEAILTKLTEPPEPVMVGDIIAGPPVEQPGA